MLPAQARLVCRTGLQPRPQHLLLDLVRELNDSGDYHALYCSLESVQGIDDAERGIPAIVEVLKAEVRYDDALERYAFAEKVDYQAFNTLLRRSLTDFCKKLDLG